MEVDVMRYCTTLFLLLVAATLTFGCAQVAENPVAPTGNNLSVAGATASNDAGFTDPHMLWGQWTLYFNEDHTSVDVVPMRQARLHLNALKFLESYCADCLEVTKIKNNGNSTIDLTVKITHPFNGFPQYTGFDVKGIIMFNGSAFYKFFSYDIFPYQGDLVVSWKELGDPDVLNADGYTTRWCPDFESGSSLPIFNYWPGKYSNGTPTANLNAFLNFCTDEDRHMFRVDGEKERTYKIWLPPGPVAAGYAVDASWCPPDVMPVTDPINDFPISANQPEPYLFNVVVNNGEVITQAPCCGCFACDDCSDLYLEYLDWYGDGSYQGTLSTGPDDGYGIGTDTPCAPGTAPSEHCYAPGGVAFTDQEDGVHRAVACIRNYGDPDLWDNGWVFTVFDYEIDLD